MRSWRSPILVSEELGMKPEDFSLLYQDTDAAPWDMGSCGSQTTVNSGRAVLEAAMRPSGAAARRGRGGAGGLPRETSSSPRAPFACKGLRTSPSPSPTWRDRERRSTARVRRPAGDPFLRRRGLCRAARTGVVPLAAADHARRARQGRPRDRRRPRPQACRLPRLRRDRQQARRRRAGLRRRRHGHRSGAAARARSSTTRDVS